MKNCIKRMVCFGMALSMTCALVLMLAFHIRAEEATESENASSKVLAQTGESTEALIEEQIRAFAKSLDQTNAVDNAAEALATHGMFGGGRKLSVGKNHALTATILNSEVAQKFLIDACTRLIDFLQKTGEESLFAHGAYNWYSSGHYYSLYIYKNDQIKASDQINGRIEIKNITGNAYDNSMLWMGGSVYTGVTMHRKAATADTITYEVAFRAYDRFDFSTSSGEGFKDLISGLGALLLREFDWESKVTFEIVVPNTCTHSTQNYHWIMNPETWDIESDTADGYTENATLKYEHEISNSSVRRYYKLAQTVVLSHNKPWEMELIVTNPKNILFGTLGNGYDEYPGLMLNGRTFFCARQCERAEGENGAVKVSAHCYGTALRPNFSFVSDSPYKLCLENRIADDGSNMIYLTVYNHAGGVSLQTVALDTYYFSDNKTAHVEKETGSNGACGMDFRINYFGSATNQIVGESLQFSATSFELKIWENGKDNSGDYFKFQVTAPTCTSNGYTTHTCSLCGYSYRDSYVSAKGHTMGEWRVAASPTCTEQGEERRDCNTCDHFETRGIDKIGHSYNATVTHPTCTERGYTAHACHCGDSYVDGYVDALGHRLGEWTQTQAPTCIRAGQDRRECEVCDYEEIKVVEALGHRHEAVVTEPSCTMQGYTTHTCHCGDVYVDSYVEALEHLFGEWTRDREPSCTYKGFDRRDCEACNHFELREILPTGHSYKAEVLSASCTQWGYIKYICHCGDSYIDDYNVAYGHKYGDWAVTNAPSCTEKGSESRECSVCKDVETREIAATGHCYVLTVTNPTCTERGYTSHDCHCGDNYVDGYVEAKGHSFSAWTEAKAPTCADAGQEQRSCATCAYVETREIEKVGHVYEAIVIKPTCDEQGFTTHICVTCKDSYVDRFVSALGHKYGAWTTDLTPTCTESGRESRGCISCGHVETKELEAIGHKYHVIVTKPTCTEQGYTTHVCQCGDSYADHYVDAVGHKFGKWREIEEPTCKEPGKERRDCSVCAFFETREIEATGHSYTTVVTQPTCTDQGYTTHVCHCDDSYVDNYVNATGHTYGDWGVTIEPTCTNAGEEHRFCDACGQRDIREIKAKGHSYDVAVTPPNCTEQGYTLHACRCGDSYVDAYLDALGHTFDEWMVIRAATCTEDGEERRACTACSYIEARTLAVLGHDLISHTAREATCTEIGWREYEACSRCDYTTYAEIAATGHEHHCTVTPPTCESEGFTTHTCACGDSYVDSYVDAAGHELSEWMQTKAPDCTEGGEERRVCVRCNYDETREVPSGDHADSDGNGDCDTCGQPMSNEERPSNGCRSTLTISSCSMILLVIACHRIAFKKKKE